MRCCPRLVGQPSVAEQQGPAMRSAGKPVYQVRNRGDRIQARQVEIDLGKIDPVFGLDAYDDLHGIERFEPAAREQEIVVANGRAIALKDCLGISART